MKKNMVSLYLFLLFPVFIFSQTTPTTISGFIYEESNGEAIIGANVYIEGLFENGLCQIISNNFRKKKKRSSKLVIRKIEKVKSKL